MLIRIGLTLVLWVGISTNMQAEQRTVGFDELLNDIKITKNKYNIAGVGLAIVDQNSRLHTAFIGLADRQRGIPINKDTVFRVGSITKTFTSLAILRLVEQGKIDLNEEVSTYLPKSIYTNTYSSSPIRVAHLLEHTAGFHDMDAREWDFKQANWTLGQSLQYSPTSRKTAWKPGEYYSYTNSGAGIAGYMIEQVTGKNFEDFVRDEIFAPLDYQDATFQLNERIKSRLAVGYDVDGSRVIPYWHMLYRPFGAMNMRVDEMAKAVRLLINYGRADDAEIFTKQSIQRMEKSTTTLAARHGLEYGYGLGNYAWVRDGVVFHGHGGDADGYLAHYGYTRKNNKGYFLVINAFHGVALREMRRHIETWLVSDVTRKNAPVEYALNKQQIKNIVGIYQSVTKRFSFEQTAMLKVFEQKGRIYTQLNKDDAIELIAVNNHHFRRANQPVATISIVQDAQGARVLQGDVGNFIKSH